jgi:hypothetical protein
MNDRLGRLRVAHDVRKSPHPLRVRGVQAGIGQNALEILMPVQPG